MIRKFPLTFGALGLAAIVSSYVAFADAAERAISNRWERHVVRDGHALMPASGERWFGMYRPELPWDYRRFDSVSAELGVEPRVISFYQAWGDGPEHAFKSDAVEAAFARSATPLITWEPWLSAFGAKSVAAPQDSVKHVIAGDYDDYLKRYAREVLRAQKPLFIRPFHEIGNPWYTWTTAYNSPADVAEAYRHVVRVFRAEGARNAVFVWTPYTPDDFVAWPGDTWVDWIGLDIFNFGALMRDPRWESFRELVTWQLEQVTPHHKPVLLAEVGCADLGGDQAAWWREAFEALASPELSAVRLVVIYDNPTYTSHDAHAPVHLGITRHADTPRKLKEQSQHASFSVARNIESAR